MNFEDWQQRSLNVDDIAIDNWTMRTYAVRFMSKADRDRYLGEHEVDENLDPREVERKVDEYLDDPKRGEKHHLRHLISH